jgi:phospholipid transport system substrate-binding protein
MGFAGAWMRISTGLVLFGLFTGTPVLWAGGPMEGIRATTGRILQILSDPSLEGKEHREERRREIREAVDERFDWEAIARSALSTQWRNLSAAEKDEFTRLFSSLVERTYMDRLEEYSGEDVVYLEEETFGTRAKVRVKIVTRKNQEIPVEYRLRRGNGEWRVYDILIEGVSLVKNYRVQFNDILAKSSYAELVERLKAKVRQES